MKPKAQRRPNSVAQIFAMPLAIACASAIGLIAALVGDGIWDAIGWSAFGVPLIVTAWFLWRPSNLG